MRDLIWYLFLGSLSAVVFFSGVSYEKREAKKNLDRLFKHHCEADDNGKILPGLTKEENKVFIRCLFCYRGSYYE